MLQIHEFTTVTGTLSKVFLSCRDGALCIVEEEGAWPLPAAALEAVMHRYGLPFDPDAMVTSIAELDLDERTTIRHVRHLAPFDVIALDYLVYERSDQPPLYALATTVSGALAHLARAWRA